MERLHEPADDDPVSDLLRSLQVRSTVYCHSEMHAPWGFAVHPRDVSVFHLVSEGGCWLEVDGLDEPVRLESGDVVLLMTGRGHRVRDAPSSEVEWLDDILARNPDRGRRLRYGGSGDVTELFCGGFLVEGAQASPLVLAMPPVLRLDGREPRAAEWLSALLAMLGAEVSHPRAGSDAVLARLADILLTDAIRTYLVSMADVDEPQVGAMRDPRIAKAIRLIHGEPARSWTVSELAAEVAMSRSAFSPRFHQLTGESPMRYVTRCRLALAASLLGDGSLSLFDIATRTGYDSEASLTRAFSRTFGVAPGGYRRRLQDKVPPMDVRAVPEVIDDENG